MSSTTTTTVTRTAPGTPQPAIPSASPSPGPRKGSNKGTITLNSASKAKEVDDLLSGIPGLNSHLDSLAQAAASEKEAKQRAERDLEVERSKLAAHQRKEKDHAAAAGRGRGKSDRDHQVLHELKQLGLGLDGAETNFKSTKSQFVSELDGIRARAEAAEATGKTLRVELATMKGEAEVTRKRLEGELASAKHDVATLTAQVKENYDKHVEELKEQKQSYEAQLDEKEDLLDRVIEALRMYQARLETYGKNL